jgi:transcription elongation factor Elf1
MSWQGVSMQEPSDSCATCGHVKHRIVIVTDLMPPHIYTVECGYCGTLRLMRLNPVDDGMVNDQ